jgi:Tol biopolymer transport system component
MVMRLVTLVAMIAVALSSLRLCSAAEDEWWILARSDAKSVAVREDGKEQRVLPHVPPLDWGTELSPDRSRVVYASEGKVFVADPDRKNPKKLTDDVQHPNEPPDEFGLGDWSPSPAWSPDGKRIVFASPRSGRWQIYVMDSDGANVRQLTNHEKGAVHPQFSADGRIAYLELRSRGTKIWEVDLAVMDSKASRTLDTGIYAFAWSPDGKLIAYSKMGSLFFHHFETGETQQLDFTKIAKELNANYTASHIRWRPDGKAVACRIFWPRGAVAGEKILGDEELFVIPIKEKPHYFRLEMEFGFFEWISGKDLPR